MDFDIGFVIASEAKQSRLSVRREPFVWIASLSLAMTAHSGFDTDCPSQSGLSTAPI